MPLNQAGSVILADMHKNKSQAALFASAQTDTEEDAAIDIVGTETLLANGRANVIPKPLLRTTEQMGLSTGDPAAGLGVLRPSSGGAIKRRMTSPAAARPVVPNAETRPASAEQSFKRHSLSLSPSESQSEMEHRQLPSGAHARLSGLSLTRGSNASADSFLGVTAQQHNSPSSMTTLYLGSNTKLTASSAGPLNQCGTASGSPTPTFCDSSLSSPIGRRSSSAAAQNAVRSPAQSRMGRNNNLKRTSRDSGVGSSSSLAESQAGMRSIVDIFNFEEVVGANSSGNKRGGSGRLSVDDDDSAVTPQDLRLSLSRLCPLPPIGGDANITGLGFTGVSQNSNGSPVARPNDAYALPLGTDFENSPSPTRRHMMRPPPLGAILPYGATAHSVESAHCGRSTASPSPFTPLSASADFDLTNRHFGFVRRLSEEHMPCDVPRRHPIGHFERGPSFSNAPVTPLAGLSAPILAEAEEPAEPPRMKVDMGSVANIFSFDAQAIRDAADDCHHCLGSESAHSLGGQSPCLALLSPETTHRHPPVRRRSSSPLADVAARVERLEKDNCTEEIE